MSEAPHESRIVSAFVKLADTMADVYDPLTVAQSLVAASLDIVGSAASGFVLIELDGELTVVSSEGGDEGVADFPGTAGPCLESYESGAAVTVLDLAERRADWPGFADRATEVGFRSAHAAPLRLRSTTVGAICLLSTELGSFTPAQTAILRGLADVAAIGILNHRAIRESETVRAQLQHALESRIVIEQAKGVIAQAHGIDVEQAFRRLLAHARSNRLALTEAASQIVTRSLSI